MSHETHRIELSGLDGANPLGFLAAVGTLVVLSEDGANDVRLGWKRGAVWRPFVTGVQEPHELVARVCKQLQGREIPPDAEKLRLVAKKGFEEALRLLKKRREEVKSKRLRGKELAAAKKRILAPVEGEVCSRRAEFLESLSAAVPRLELSIGKKVDLSGEEFRAKAESFLAARQPDISAISMLAALSAESINTERCVRTPFDLLDSSGQLAFLDAVLNLIANASENRLHSTLFEPWERKDEKFSLRIDPVEDRRYSLLDRNPTSGNNKSTTEWMANLLAYRALSLFPCATTRSGVETSAWSELNGEACFSWPLWANALSLNAVRSLLVLRDIVGPNPPETIRHLGVNAVYRVRRIATGDYLNFSSTCVVL